MCFSFDPCPLEIFLPMKNVKHFFCVLIVFKAPYISAHGFLKIRKFNASQFKAELIALQTGQTTHIYNIHLS